jgi:putative glycosyltransferase (TIGR04372 family)
MRFFRRDEIESVNEGPPVSVRRRTMFAILLTVTRARFREGGIAWVLRRITVRAATELAWLVLLPAGVLFHLAGFRRIIVRSEHIGHLTTEIDAFLKDLRLGCVPARRWILAVPPSRNANPHLVGYWRKHLTTFTSPTVCQALELATRRWVGRHDLAHYMARFFGTQGIYHVNRLWAGRPPLLRLDAADEAWARNALPAIGIPSGRWFVCVHVREGGFLPRNELIQSHRNADIVNAVPAMREIVARGGLCVRMGDSTMAKLPAMDGVIDYAHSPAKSARFDVVLCAKAHLFVGCTSGLAFLSAIFGVPVAHANMIPVSTLGIGPGDLSIPKYVYSLALARRLTYPELFSGDVCNYFFTQQYERAGLRIEENSADDIHGLVLEALGRIAGTFTPTPGDEDLHRRFIALFRPGDYAFGAASRVGLDFLRRNRDLI